MRVIEVIPIVKGITRPTLSYFSRDKFTPGDFVKAPVRSGMAMGIVEKSIDAQTAKSSLKKANFALKKISLVEEAGSLSIPFMKAAEDTANFYATTVGSVLGAVLPKLFLESPSLIGKPRKIAGASSKEIRVVQLTDKERFLEYRSIVRESFARNTSVLFVVPSKEDALRAKESLSVGIEDYVYSTVGKTPKTLKKLFVEARDMAHPILFITTPAYIAFDRHDLDTIILERENSRAYRTQSRPYINIKTFLEYYARAKGSTLIFGDSVLSIQSLWLERESVYTEFTPLTWRLKRDSETEIVDMRSKKNFHIFSQRLEDVVHRALAENKKIFLFGARKGLASTTVCGDCGSVLLCRNCSSPLVLHQSTNNPETAIYICHHCGVRRSSEIRCDQCQSWKLTPLGVGIERIAEECAKKFPDTEVLVLDKDHASTSKEAREIVKKFEENSRAILVGTELAFSYLNRVPIVAAASLDALLSVPDFYINERIFYLVTHLRELSTEKFLLQTRNAGTEILELAAAGNILDFYRKEISERAELRYPPFSIFIKVITEGRREQIEQKAVDLQHLFKHFEPHFILETRSNKDLQTLSMILRVPRDEWPDVDLKERLLLLSPDFLIKVDPESIL